ncbi:MAG: 4-demethylwyosine synthase TYW1, partial [Candidatus Altiarchaeales archaeon]
LKNRHYHIVGKHSAVKLCLWTKKSILDEGFCYKEKFYGIRSHRCLQMSPAVIWCTHRCIHCWRYMHNIDLKFDNTKIDEPEFIVENSINAQRILLSGYGGIPDRINLKKYEESKIPNQAAISLSGEPTLYPRISELIEEFHKRGFTTFLVTNGTLPERIRNLDELPTQLYLSLNAPDEETYKIVCRPLIRDGWSRITETLEVLKSIETRSVIRITLIKDVNDRDIDGYGRLIERAEPDFVEVKAYMFVGESRRRLSLENMPSFQDVRKFSEELSVEIGYDIRDYKEDSRVVLLA